MYHPLNTSTIIMTVRSSFSEGEKNWQVNSDFNSKYTTKVCFVVNNLSEETFQGLRRNKTMHAMKKKIFQIYMKNCLVFRTVLEEYRMYIFWIKWYALLFKINNQIGLSFM